MRKTPRQDVEKPAMQFAKREMQRLYSSPKTWIGCAAAGLILGMTGPFGTDETLRLVPRLLYWVTICVGSFFFGSVASTFCTTLLRPLGWPRMVRMVPAALCTGCFLTAGVILLNAAIFGYWPTDSGDLLAMVVEICAISVIVAFTSVLLEHEPNPKAQPEEAPKPHTLLNRLPFDKRGDLISISVDDHYVNVTTTKGHDMLLMRFADAVSEVPSDIGLQVHRSHWVALSHIREARRDGAKILLGLSDGRDIPVSRTYVPAVKEAGLLPG